MSNFADNPWLIRNARTEYDRNGEHVWLMANYDRRTNVVKPTGGIYFEATARAGNSPICNFARAAVAHGYMHERLVVFCNLGHWHAYEQIGRLACYMLVEEPALRYAPYIPPQGTVERWKGGLGSYYKGGPLNDAEIEAAKRYSQVVGMKFNIKAAEDA